MGPCLFAQLNPGAFSVLDFTLRQLGPGMALVCVISYLFFWFLRNYSARQVSAAAESQSKYQEQLDRLVAHFTSQNEHMMRRHEAALQDLRAQVREVARENSDIWREVMLSNRSIERTVSVLTIVVRRLAAMWGAQDTLFPGQDTGPDQGLDGEV